jgi:hypothetical protein
VARNVSACEVRDVPESVTRRDGCVGSGRVGMVTRRWGCRRFESGTMILLRLRWKARTLVSTMDDDDEDLWGRWVESRTRLCVVAVLRILTLFFRILGGLH